MGPAEREDREPRERIEGVRVPCWDAKRRGGHLHRHLRLGAGYVELALELGVRPERIDTTIDFAAVEEHGVKAEGAAEVTSADVLAELAGMIDKGVLEIPIAKVYPLLEVQDAYRELEQHHTRGKIVLKP